MDYENATMIINAFDEYYIFRRKDNTYFIRYSEDFYEKHAKLLPEFSISQGQNLYEELSEEEVKDFILNTIDYYGETCILDKEYKKLLNS